MEYVKVKDHSNLVRDPKSNSIINTNKSAYNQYVARRNAKNEEVNKAQTTVSYTHLTLPTICSV